MLNALDNFKKAKMSDKEEDTSIGKEGLNEAQMFPDLPLLSASGDVVKLHSLLKRRTAIAMQPGTSHTDQWKDRAEDLKLWKSLPGAAGCTDQLLNYKAQYEDFQNAETDIILILSNKTSSNLQDIMTNKAVPFQIYSLTPEAARILQDMKHPFFEFQGNQYPQRETFLLDTDFNIQKVMGRKLDSPDACKDEAQRTLDESKKCSFQPG